MTFPNACANTVVVLLDNHVMWLIVPSRLHVAVLPSGCSFYSCTDQWKDVESCHIWVWAFFSLLFSLSVFLCLLLTWISFKYSPGKANKISLLYMQVNNIWYANHGLLSWKMWSESWYLPELFSGGRVKEELHNCKINETKFSNWLYSNKEYSN